MKVQCCLQFAIWTSCLWVRASQNYPNHMKSIFFRDNSKSFALSGLKLLQSSSEPKSIPWANFHTILRDEGVKFEKFGLICRGNALYYQFSMVGLYVSIIMMVACTSPKRLACGQQSLYAQTSLLQARGWLVSVDIRWLRVWGRYEHFVHITINQVPNSKNLKLVFFWATKVRQ